MKRRGFLAASIALAAAPLVARPADNLMPRGKRRRVVIVGGGWGGLSAARQLRLLAPELEVVLLEKNAAFRSGPLSNRWLVGLVDPRYLVHDYAAAARAFDYRYIRAEVLDIDRAARRVVTSDGVLDYDWLVLAVGIRYDYAPWFGDDARAIEQTRRNYPGGFLPGEDLAPLKDKLERFAGGELLMTVPAMPYRCPPAPYERACFIGRLLKSRRIKGRLTVVDPNPMNLSFSKVVAEQYPEQIRYLPDTQVKAVDPFKRTLSTEFDDFPFDDAILMAPQQAGELVWKAGLIARDGGGRATGWADQHPVHLHAVNDERVFLIGDLMGRVSTLFGYYPKTGHLASRLGAIAAREIAARARDTAPEALLPDNVCYVYSRVEPLELTRIDSQYRLRGDGLIVQTVEQHRDPNPRDEDLHWATAMFAEMLAFKG